MRKPEKIELTAEDWAHADKAMTEDPREFFRERFARQAAYERIVREEAERRRQRLHRFSVGLLGRH